MHARPASFVSPQHRFFNIPTLSLLAGGAAMLLPYLLLPVLPGTDFPNDLARLAVLGAAPGAPIRASFVPHWALMPDLGLDLAYWTCKSIASPENVLRLCLVGAMAAMLALVWAIQRTLFASVSSAAALAPLFIAGLPVVLGFVNFVMSSALALLGVFLWLRWRGQFSPLRVLALSAVASAAWLCHFAGHALLLLFLVSAEASAFFRAPGWRKAWQSALLLAAVALPSRIMSLLAEPETVASSDFQYRLYALRGLLAPVLTTGTGADYLIWLGAVLILVPTLCFGTWRIAPPAKAAIAVLLLTVAALPWSIGAATDVGSRLICPVMVLLLAVSEITLPFGRWGARVLLCALSLLILGRGAALTGVALQDAATVAAFRQAAQAIPPGATLMQANDAWRAADCSRAATPFSAIGPATHLAAYATLDRGVWEPFIFAAAGKQPIRSAAPFATGELPAMHPPALNDLPGLGPPGIPPDQDRVPEGFPARYGYLLVTGRSCTQNPNPALLASMTDGPGFSLYRIRK